MDNDELIYLYSWNPREEKIYEYVGYKCNGMLCTKPGDIGSWVCHIPNWQGQYFNNKVWFRKPNKKRALLIFITHENDVINKLRDEITKHSEKIRVLANMEDENGNVKIQRKDI